MKLSPFAVLVAMAVVGSFAAPAASQGREEQKQELAALEAAATDAESLMEVARWAAEHELRTDYKRLLNKVVGLDPDHAEAREGLGYVRHEGEWMLRTKRDLLVKKQQEAAFEAQGLTKVQGVWVPEDEVADGERGIFHHEGQMVTRGEKLALVAGKVRHPITGAFIAAEDLEKANQALYQVGDTWTEWQEADKYHASEARPWVWRTRYATIVTTVSIGYMEQIAFHVDDAIQAAKPLFGGADPHPAQRPTIMVCATVPQYREVGNTIGAESSVYGAFLAEQAPEITGVEFPAPPAVANWGEQEPWGAYYLRHAAGLAYARSMARGVDGRLPPWILTGVGSLVERHTDPGVAKFFGQQHLASGGIDGLESWGTGGLSGWFGAFAISADLPADRITHNVYQAGLLLAFAMRGRDRETTAAAMAFTKSFDGGGEAVHAAAMDLQTMLGGKEAELRAFLKQIIEQG